MLRRVFFLLLITLFCYKFSLAADLGLEPNKITAKISDWKNQAEFKNEKYFSIYYIINEKRMEIGRILERFMPDFNLMLIRAHESNSLIYKTNADIFFCSLEALEAGFKVRQKKGNILNLTYDGFNIRRKAAKSDNTVPKYFLTISNSKGISISSEFYSYLLVIQALAKRDLRGVHFNLNNLCFAKKNNLGNFDQIAWLGDLPLTMEQSCVICLNHPKQILIEPCFHLCLCEECGADVDKCPLCRQKCGTMKKVYW